MGRSSSLLLFTFGFIACVGDSPVGGQDSGSDAGGDVAVNDSGPQDTGTPDTANPFDGNLFGGLELWVSADHGVTNTDAGVVSTWVDRSVKARTISVPQSDSNCVTGPTLVPSAIHGLPAMSFNGSTQCLSVSGDFKDITNGVTTFAVIEPANCNSTFTGNNGGVFDSYDNTTFNYLNGIAIHRNYAESAQIASVMGSCRSSTPKATAQSD